MSDIDKILKNAIDGYEAPFDPQAWDKLSNQLNPLEDAVRDAVDGYEAPYDPKAWTGVKKHLSNSSITNWLIGSAAAIGVVAGTIALFPSDNDKALLETTARIETENNTPNTINETVTEHANTALTSASEDINNTPETLNGIVPNSDIEVAESNDRNDNIALVNDNEDRNDTNQTSDSVDQTNQVDENTNSDNQNNTQHITVNETDNNTNKSNNENDVLDENVITPVYDAHFSLNKTEICQGEKVLMNPKLVHNNILYTWNFGDGTFSNQTNPVHEFKEPGNFDVELTLRDAHTNKIITSTTEQVKVNALPKVDFNWEKNNQIIPTIDFINLSEESSKWLWKIDGVVHSDATSFEHTFRSKGDHTVELWAQNAAGCEQSLAKNISVEDDYNLLAPTAFTPNNDNRNETFIPEALKLMNTEFVMTIYNQEGKMVYQTNNAAMPWNGTDINDHTAAPDGAYIWIVRLKNGNGTLDEYKGQVFVTR